MASGGRHASWDFQPGAAIGPGRAAVRLLGGGNQAEAWLGWDEHLATIVVFKMLRPDRVDDERARDALGREAATLRELAHPNIVRCFDARLEEERPYLVLEFLDGPRLSTLIRRTGPLAHEQLISLAVEIGSAVAYLHNEGRLHLDIKPQNLIMGARPHLIDLSIARRIENVATIRSPIGTAAYMAPEQCDSERFSKISAATDVWGLGATLFEAVNGQRPFRRGTDEEPYPQLSDAPAAFRPGIMDAISAAVLGCLNQDPERRPTIPDLLERFDDLLYIARGIALRRLRRRVR